MSIVLCDSLELTNIADAIRFKTGSSEKLTLEGMSTRITNISGGAETVDLTFPSGLGAIWYYTNANGEFTQYKSPTTTSMCTITCIKNTIVVTSDKTAFEGDSYLLPNTSCATILNSGGGMFLSHTKVSHLIMRIMLPLNSFRLGVA